MLNFISKDVQEYMEQNHLEFTDFEKAALIYHAGFPLLEMLERLEKLAGETNDKALREQIHARLASNRQDMEVFRDNTEGYVYAVILMNMYDKKYMCDKYDDAWRNRGYFATADMAFAHGMNQGGRFIIAKYRVVGFQGREPNKSKGYQNPYLFKNIDLQEYGIKPDYKGREVASAEYDKDGILTSFWSDEIERTEEERLSDPTRFERAFIRIPNPFELGDIVRLTDDHSAHGIVATSQEKWVDSLKKLIPAR